MNKVIAEITTEQNSVVHGDHNIITTVELKDGVGPFDAGTKSGTFLNGIAHGHTDGAGQVHQL